jgi:hypothetical protein
VVDPVQLVRGVVGLARVRERLVRRVGVEGCDPAALETGAVIGTWYEWAVPLAEDL